MREFSRAALLFLALTLAAGAPAGKRVEAEAVEVRGNMELSVGAVLRGVDITKNEGRISVDLTSLDRVLSGNPSIGSYRVRMEGARLVVDITESASLLIAAVSSGSSTVLFEVDTELKIVSKNNLRSPFLPIIYTEAGEISAEGFSPEFIKLAESLNTLRINDSPLYREISEIRIRDREITLKARGRGTLFVMGTSVRDFMKLKKVVGYMDRSGRGYSLCDLRQEPAVLR